VARGRFSISVAHVISGLSFALMVAPVRGYAAVEGTEFHVDFRNVGSDARVELEPARTDRLTVTIGGTGAGTVTSSPGGINCAGSVVSCTGAFPEGSSVTLTAAPDTGMVFVGWAGACAGTSTCTISVNGPQSVVANFASPLQYYHLDVLGSVRMITDAAGAVVSRSDYYAFGEELVVPTGDPKRFTGKELDPETALQYFGARYYRNVWGRFTSPDPGQASGSPEDPQGWNAYAYARNNPLRFVDPTGLTYVIFSAGSGTSTVDDAQWQPMIRNPGQGFMIQGDLEGGTIWAWINGTWTYAGTYSWLSKDPGKFERFVGDIARMSKPGLDAALAIGLMGSAPMLATLAPAEGATTLGRFSLSNWGLNNTIGAGQRELLRRFFTSGQLPSGLNASSLRMYRELAQRAISRGVDTLGVQAERIRMIEAALKQLGGK